MAGTDGNTGGADATGTATLSGSGTGSTAAAGLNPTGAEVEGNNAALVNEATGAKGVVGNAADEGKDPETVIEKLNAEKAKQASLKIDGDGDYDAASGIIRSGEVTLTGTDGVTVTKRAG